MLRFVLLTITLCLSACDDPAPPPDADDVSFRPGPGGIKYDTASLGDPNFVALRLDKARYDLVKIKSPFEFRLMGDSGQIDAELDDLLGAWLRLRAKHKGQSVLANAEVIDIIETVPTALIIEIPDPDIEICDIVDGVLIIASTGECPE